MKTPAEPDVKTQPIGDATKPSETHHADITHFEDGTEQPLVRVDPGKGLESSPLSKLPPELRTMIFEMALIRAAGMSLRAGAISNGPHGDELHSGYVFLNTARLQRALLESLCPTTSWALGFMATCHQIRSETKDAAVLALNDVNVHGVEFCNVERQQPGIWSTVPLIRKISYLLGMPSGRVVLWQNWNGHYFAQYERDRRAGLPVARLPELDDSLSRYARAIQPFQLFIELSMNYPNLGGSSNVPVCKRDAPVTLTDCSRIQCIVPLGDRVMARKTADEAIDGRLRLLRRHFSHRLCNVRGMRQKLESGLATARQYMREEVDQIC